MSFTDVWTNADPDAAGGGDNSEPPPEGTYETALTEAEAFLAKSSGQATVKMVWRVAGPEHNGHEWTEILQFHKSQGQANFSKGQCKALGVDVDAVSGLEQLDGALREKVGGYYTVETKQNGSYRNTYIIGASGGTQTDIPVDLPPTPDPGDDNDVPF